MMQASEMLWFCTVVVVAGDLCGHFAGWHMDLCNWISWPLNRLLREGVALINMKARKRGRLFGEQIYQFYCEREAGYHRFMVGDIVTVSRWAESRRLLWMNSVLLKRKGVRRWYGHTQAWASTLCLTTRCLILSKVEPGVIVYTTLDCHNCFYCLTELYWASVCFFLFFVVRYCLRNNPLRPDAEGVVHSRSHGTVSLVLKGLPGARDTVFRLDKGTNKLPYQRMRAALLCLSGIDCKAPSWLQPLLVPTALWIVNQNDWQRQERNCIFCSLLACKVNAPFSVFPTINFKIWSTWGSNNLILKQFPQNK